MKSWYKWKDQQFVWMSQVNIIKILCLVSHLCPTLCNPMDCSPPGSSVRGEFPDKNTGVGYHAVLQGIFPTQVSCTAGKFFTI